MQRISGVFQHYAWGDLEFIPRLAGFAPDGRPWAEWWFGTHPLAAAHTVGDDGTAARPLRDVVGELPYLLKIIAAAEPLSLQTHPDADRARAGFDLEQLNGPAIDDPARLFRDASAKPEILCALESFEVLCGIRPIGESVVMLRAMRASVADQLADLIAGPGIADGLRAVFIEQRFDPSEIGEMCRTRTDLDPVVGAVAALADRYPYDPALAAALLLNHRVLAPGDAIFLGAGNLHAYLRGSGVELMGSSDNVLRAGFTTKHVDPAALLDALDTTALDEPVIRPVALGIGPGLVEYPTPTPDWRLRRIELDGETSVRSEGPSILLCAAGATNRLRVGQAAVLEAGERCDISGRATIYWAAGLVP